MWALGWAGWDRLGVPALPVSPRSRGRDASALNLARFGACADELRFMGVERDELPINLGSGEGV